MRLLTRVSMLAGAALAVGAVALFPSLALADGPPGSGGPFVGPLHTVSTIASTVPGNGDVNPYGTAVVPRSDGMLVQGDVLVSNFNDGSNLQGTGSTIVEVAPNGSVQQFAQIDAAALAPGSCPGGVGLTTALVVLRTGWVIVGSLPTSDGTSATATQPGCLLVLNSQGQVEETLTGQGINGPWDMTALDLGGFVSLFVTNVLNGTVAAGGAVVNEGTVLRIDLGVFGDRAPVMLGHPVTVASGFPERTDPNALVIGPTGVGIGQSGSLYVADTLSNRIAKVPDALFREASAGTGQTVSAGGALDGPLGLAIAPNGDILTVNSANGNLVDTSPFGAQLATRPLDTTGTPPPGGAGALFGLAVAPGPRGGVYFVDDGTNAPDDPAANTLNLLH
jgi:hypothetical protein